MDNNRETYMWSVNRRGVESMEYEEDKRSEGEIYSDVDSMDGYARERRGRDKTAVERDNDNRKDDKDRDRGKESDHGRSSRRDRSRDRDRHHKGKGSRRSSERKRSRSRDSSRGRHERKSRSHKHKGRHRRHSSSDSRSSSGGHSRRRRSRSRSYDSYGSSDGSRDYYSDYYGERGSADKSSDSYKYQEPNSTVMVRGLVSHLTEQDIRADILKCGIMVKDIRLIRHRETGASRGFAFVEFHSVQDATRWMEMKQGTLVLQDEYHASLIYSIPKAPFSEKSRAALSDWYCTKCQGHNFKRREFCYKCHNPRPDEQDPELTEELSTHPTNTIILYNLDALTTEEGILQAFKGRPSLASIPIRSVRIARESVTNLSRGMCYVETNNVADAVRLYTLLTQEAFDVDSRQAGVAYCKPTQHGTGVSNVAATALAAAQWTNSGKPSSYDEDQIEKMAQYSASLYAKTPEEHVSYLDYYRNYYKNQKVENDSKHGQSAPPGMESATNNAAAVSVVKASSGSNAPSVGVDRVDSQATSSAHVPDTSGYQYDEASGYYYDPVSGYYYDPGTQYFYDSSKQQYLYWSPEQNKYVPVSETAPSTNQSSSATDAKSVVDKKKEKKLEKPDKVKVAKKIAKDMEKWAKTLNQKKEGIKTYVVNPESSSNGSNAVAESDTVASGEGQLYKRLDVGMKPAVATAIKSVKPLLTTPFGEVESDSDEEVLKQAVSNTPGTVSQPAPDSLVDFSKLACLLCKRQFPNKEVLMKHTKLSDLHKKNLEELRSVANSSKTYSDPSSSYRDRAKERRMKFGSDPIEGKNTLKDLYMQAKKDSGTSYVEEPTRDGIKMDNVGNRMLQKMGWQEGQGLGKGNQGRTDIIHTQRRAPNAGLGLRAMPMVDEEDDRYSRARKLTLARYQELE